MKTINPNIPNEDTQAYRLLMLLRGGTITRLEAIIESHILSFHEAVHKLRKSGFQINMEMILTKEGKKYYGVYTLVE